MNAPRRALVVLAVVLAVPAAAYGTLRFLLRDEALRPRLVAAVEQATGRRLSIAGPIGLKLSLVPTLTLEGVALSNPPGASRPDMLTAGRVEASLALLPLLSRHVALEQVTLIDPDLLLERDATGRGNWLFGPPRAPAAPTPAAAAPATAPAEPLQLSIAAAGVQGGRVAWLPAPGGRTETLEIGALSLRAAAPTAPMELSGQVTWRGVSLAAEGQSGPLPRLLGATAEPAAWPLRLALSAPGLRAVLDGAVSRPEAAAGWHATLDASADRAERLAPLLPGLSLPPLLGLEVQAELADAGAGLPPRLLSLRASTDGGDLGALLPGLALGAATLAIPAENAPPQAEAAVTLRGTGWQMQAALPPPATLLSAAPWPVTVALRGEGISMRAEGMLAGSAHRDWDGRLELQAADTTPLLQALALPWPKQHDLRLATGLARDAAGVTLAGLQLSTRELALEGGASIATTGPRPAIHGVLHAPRIDLDALLHPLPAASPATSPAPAVPATPAVPQPANTDRMVIPPLPLPFGWLLRLDADLRLTVGELVANGITYRDQRATLALAGGRLVADPVSLGIPGGRLFLALRADATATPPQLALKARHEGAGLELRPLLQSYHLPAQADGRLELDAELAGRGGDLRSQAASLNGSLGLAVANGQVDVALLDRVSGELRRLLLPEAPAGGSTPLRCLALRVALRDGVARPEALLLESGLGNVAGSGEIDLGQERLNLRLLPQVRLGGVGISAPVRVTGSFAKPGYRLDQGGAAQAAAGIVGELASRQRESGVAALGQLAEALAGRPGGGLPDCAQQLAVARGGRAGPVPPAEARPEQRRVNPGELLRGLLGR